MKKVTRNTIIAFLNETNKRETNTIVQVNDDNTTLSLHNNIIAINTNGVIEINNKGYLTQTTKERLNGILELIGKPTIYQSKGVWYRDIDGVKTEFPTDDWVTI